MLHSFSGEPSQFPIYRKAAAQNVTHLFIIATLTDVNSILRNLGEEIDKFRDIRVFFSYKTDKFS